jgi:cytochrome P450
MALSSVFYFLLKDPIQLSKLRKELHASFKDVQAINDKELVQLPFLSGCINEALRLLPPVSGRFLARTSPGLYVDGIYVPKGVSGSSELFLKWQHVHEGL